MVSERLLEVLDRARQRGDIGERSLQGAAVHALGFVPGFPVEADRFADLGSGGGLPSLPLIEHLPRSIWVLIEARARRAAFLRRAIADLGWDDRCTVLELRAESAARESGWAGWADAVTARSFGSPPVVAECACRLLRLGGRLVVSEPPGESLHRWPAEGMAVLGFVEAAAWSAREGHYRAFVLERPPPERYPRHVGVPERRPLF